MNHCIIMTVYKDAAQINRLIKVIPSNWGIYVHIDKKSPIKNIEIDSRAKVIKKRKIYWGSINHLKAVLDLLDYALKDNNRYDYFHIISGQDFIATNPKEFDEILGYDSNIYLECVDLPYYKWECWGGGFWIYQKITLALFSDIRFRPAKVINNLISFIQLKFNLLQKLPKYKLYGGSLYCSLTKEAVKEVFNSQIGKHLLKHLRFSLCGEEIFFQTVLMNSYLKRKIVKKHLRYVDWTSNNPPKILDIDDYYKIFNKKFLFCRKIEYPRSSSLIEKLNI